MPLLPIKPSWTTTDKETVRLYQGDTLKVLQRLPSGSVQCIATSPPYWNLRDYQVEGQLGSEANPDCGRINGNCAEQDWQTGCFVCRLVLVFREARRVLRDNGLCFLNLGDSYASGEVGRHDQKEGQWFTGSNAIKHDALPRKNRKMNTGIPQGNLVGIPWRVALALQADEWILRQDIIWAKRNTMPESVRNRFTKAHEYVFMLAKKPGYYCDMEAVKEGSITGDVRKPYGSDGAWQIDGRNKWGEGAGQPQNRDGSKRNKRSVWSITSQEVLAWLSDKAPEVLSQYLEEATNKEDVWSLSSSPYPGSHFATFPEALVETIIKCATSEHGCCAKCGSPWERVVDRAETNGELASGLRFGDAQTKTTGWEPGCKCNSQVKPCTVMDIFVGSGTTCSVALVHGRHSIGIDLSETYLQDHAAKRIITDCLGRPGLAHLVPREVGNTIRGTSLLKR